MEWLIEITKALLTFAGVFITVRYSLKGKKLELDTARDSAHDEAVEKCRMQHKGDIAEVRQEFNDKLDKLSAKMDEMSKKSDEIMSEQLRTNLYVKELQKDMDKYDVMDDRLRKLENAVAAISGRVSAND